MFWNLDEAISQIANLSEDIEKQGSSENDDSRSSIALISDENLQKIYYFPVGDTRKILRMREKNSITGAILRNTASMK